MRSSLEKLRRYLHYFARLVVDRAAVVGVGRGGSQALAVVRTDGIGDFVVWLDAAHQLLKRYAGRQSILIANSLFSELAERIGRFDHVIGVDTRVFQSDLAYRFRTVRAVRRLGAEIAVYPVTSRTFWVGDALVRATGARQRIGSEGDGLLVRSWQHRMARRWYTQFLPAGSGPMAEWERNVEFLHGLGIEAAGPAVASLSRMAEVPAQMKGPGEYFVVFPGGGSPKRLWPAASFALVARAIADQTGWRLVVCGGHADVDMAQRIVDLAELDNSLSLAGKTSIPELVEVIRGARLVVGNETSAVHIAAAVGTPSVCILGGGHFGRFVPYPEGIQGAAPIPVYRPMECYGCNWRCTQPHEPGQPTPCITAIPAADVIAAVQTILPKREADVIEAH